MLCHRQYAIDTFYAFKSDETEASGLYFTQKEEQVEKWFDTWIYGGAFSVLEYI